MDTPPFIPAYLQPLFTDYLHQINIALPGFLEGFYLHGSLALGAFNPQLSDIDFIAVTSRRCTDADLATLQTIHRAIEQRYPKWQLSGSYLQWADIGKTQAVVTLHPHYHDGKLHPSGTHDINSVTWHVLKTQGITLFGPPIDQLNIDVDWDLLLADMRHNLNTYWASFINYPPRIAWLFTDYGIQWAVLGVLRQFYSFRERAITSKNGAGAYGLAHTPVRWHSIIQEALNIREGVKPLAYRFALLRAIEAWAFLKYVIMECNKEGREADVIEAP